MTREAAQTEDSGMDPLKFMKLAIGRELQDSTMDSTKDSTMDSTKDSTKDSTMESIKDSTKDSKTPLLKLLLNGHVVKKGQLGEKGGQMGAVRRGTGSNTTRRPRDQMGEMWTN